MVIGGLAFSLILIIIARQWLGRGIDEKFIIGEFFLAIYIYILLGLLAVILKFANKEVSVKGFFAVVDSSTEAMLSITVLLFLVFYFYYIIFLKFGFSADEKISPFTYFFRYSIFYFVMAYTVYLYIMCSVSFDFEKNAFISSFVILAVFLIMVYFTRLLNNSAESNRLVFISLSLFVQALFNKVLVLHEVLLISIFFMLWFVFLLPFILNNLYFDVMFKFLAISEEEKSVFVKKLGFLKKFFTVLFYSMIHIKEFFVYLHYYNKIYIGAYYTLYIYIATIDLYYKQGNSSVFFWSVFCLFTIIVYINIGYVGMLMLPEVTYKIMAASDVNWSIPAMESIERVMEKDETFIKIKEKWFLADFYRTKSLILVAWAEMTAAKYIEAVMKQYELHVFYENKQITYIIKCLHDIKDNPVKENFDIYQKAVGDLIGMAGNSEFINLTILYFRESEIQLSENFKMMDNIWDIKIQDFNEKIDEIDHRYNLSESRFIQTPFVYLLLTRSTLLGPS